MEKRGTLLRKEICHRLVEAREKCGKSQPEFAKMVGVHQTVISKLETGVTKYISDKMLQKISDETGYSSAWLLKGDGDLSQANNMDGREVSEPTISKIAEALGAPFIRYAVRRLLIVSSDAPAVSRLRSIIRQLHGEKYGREQIKEKVVRSLEAAQNYISESQPNIVLVDLSVDTAPRLLDFVETSRAANGQIVWVIHNDSQWWHHNRNFLDSRRPFGQHFENYYKLEKGENEREAYSNFVTMLTLCHRDFVLQLLREVASNIRSDSTGAMTHVQIKKFVEKAITPLLPLLYSSEDDLRAVLGRELSMLGYT